MNSVLLPVALMLWTTAAFVGAAFAASIAPKRWGTLVAPLALLVLAALPVADEARAKVRFKTLCEERAQLRVADTHVDGQPVVEGDREVSVHHLGSLIAIETVASLTTGGRPAYDYSMLWAQPGWFVRAITGGNAQEPMLFKRSCEPPQLREFLRRQHPLGPAD